MYYNTPEVYGFLNLASQGMVSAGVKKSVFNDKGTLKLNFSDMFYTGRIKGSSAYNNYQESFTVNRETRVVTIAFTYRFGNKNVAPSRRRATGAEDEKKRANSSNG